MYININNNIIPKKIPFQSNNKWENISFQSWFTYISLEFLRQFLMIRVNFVGWVLLGEIMIVLLYFWLSECNNEVCFAIDAIWSVSRVCFWCQSPILTVFIQFDQKVVPLRWTRCFDYNITVVWRSKVIWPMERCVAPADYHWITNFALFVCFIVGVNRCNCHNKYGWFNFGELKSWAWFSMHLQGTLTLFMKHLHDFYVPTLTCMLYDIFV